MTEKNEEFNFKEWLRLPLLYSVDHSATEAGQYTVEWTITSGEQLWTVLRCVQSRFKQAELDYPHTLWFRGHGKKEFVLLPSLIRSYFKKGHKCSLPQYQKMLLEKFMARSKGTPELIDSTQIKRDNEQIEYLADMQHYGVPTSLLDWSEDVSTSLFFATEKDSEDQAVLYILHPYFYNFVRNAIISLYQIVDLVDGDKYNHDTARVNVGGLVPNFSAHFNLTSKQYENYVIGPETFYSLREENRWRTIDPLKSRNTHAPMLPLAVQVPRSNPRIRSQSGTFLAFNLCEFPLTQNLQEKEQYLGFSHIELECVQKFYMESEYLAASIEGKSGSSYQAMRNRLPFLHKILIDATAARDIRNLVAMLGKRTDTVYPELFRIGEQLEEETKDV